MQVFALGGPAVARRVFGMRPDTPGIDGFGRPARLLCDGPDNSNLRAATDALGRATQDIGLDQFKPFPRRADGHLAGQSGLLTLVRGELEAAAPRTAAPVLPMPGRLPWGPLVAGLAAQAMPALRDLVVREDASDTLRRFGLNPFKRADATAAYAFLRAEDRGPWLFGTPQTGRIRPARAAYPV